MVLSIHSKKPQLERAQMFSHLTGLMFTFILAWHLQPYNPEAASFAVIILLTALGYDAYKTTKKRK